MLVVGIRSMSHPYPRSLIPEVVSMCHRNRDDLPNPLAICILTHVLDKWSASAMYRLQIDPLIGGSWWATSPPQDEVLIPCPPLVSLN